MEVRKIRGCSGTKGLNIASEFPVIRNRLSSASAEPWIPAIASLAALTELAADRAKASVFISVWAPIPKLV